MANYQNLKTTYRSVGRRLRLTGWLWILSGLAILLQPLESVQAHPLGNFSINHYSRLELGRPSINLHYIVDMAEIPAFQELGRMDDDGDDTLSRSERNAYIKKTAQQLRQGLHLRINRVEVALEPVQSRLSTPPGQAGLLTLRLQMRLKAALPDFGQEGPLQLDYQDDNYMSRYGWKEIVARPMAGTVLVGSDVPQQDRSDELRHYPKNRLNDPLDIRRAQVKFAPAAFAADHGGGKKSPSNGNAVNPSDRLAALITTKTLTLPVMLTALMLAAMLGALHALSPGHGKTIVGAYLVGTHGTLRHALILGLTVTFTHTAGVFALGFVTLFASHYLMPEQFYPWLGTLSGLIVAVMGAMLLRQRLKQSPHHHSHGNHMHHPHSHDHAHDHGHSHDESNHHHQDSGSPPTLRNLLALGVSGGLLPCPSALVVLLGAISLQRLGFGLLLILAFSFGLAAVLTAVGILFIHARALVHRAPHSKMVLKFMPLASALIITIIGLGISVQGVRQIF